MGTFMKGTQPKPEKFNWSLPDEVLAVAARNQQTVFGGPLVYDNPLAPAWLSFDQPDCGGWSADELEGIMKNYIQTVAGKFSGKIAAWEVVNEPISSGDNCWRQILGDGYIERAFRYARIADPVAQLFLNEEFGWDGVDKNLTDQFFSIVRSMKADGAPIDAVGIQMHLNAEVLRPSYPEEFHYFLQQARAAGVKVFITEMDVYQGRAGFFSDPFDVQKNIFGTIATTCLADSNCRILMVWGVSDAYTWLTGQFSDPQPLLFDDQFGEKPAYFAVLQALQNTDRKSE